MMMIIIIVVVVRGVILIVLILMMWMIQKLDATDVEGDIQLHLIRRT